MDILKGLTEMVIEGATYACVLSRSPSAWLMPACRLICSQYLALCRTDIIQNKTELEKKLDEALYAPHGTSTTILKEIATATQHRCVGTVEAPVCAMCASNPSCVRCSQDFEVIMANIWRAIGSNTRNWRPIYKGLVLLEACVKFGSER